MLKNKKYVILLLCICFVALIIRTEGLFTGNRLFLFDTARDMLYVQKIVREHDLMLIGPSSGGLQGYFHGVIWYYLLAIPFLLTNGHPLSSTAFAIVVSMLSIIAAWFVIKKSTDHHTTILAVLIWSCATFSIQSTHFSWNPYMIVWLTPIYFFAILSTLNKKVYGLPLTALCVALYIHFEAIYGITQLIPLLILIVFTWRNQTSSHLKLILLSFTFFLLPFLPYILFDLRHNFLITQTLSQALLSGGETVTTRSDLILDDPFQRLIIRSNDWFKYTFNFTPYLLANAVIAVGIVALIIVQIRQKQSHILLSVIISALFAPLLLFIFYRHAVWSYYWIGNAPLISLFALYLLHQLHIHQKIRLFVTSSVSIYAALTLITILPNWYSGAHNPGVDNFKTQQKIAQTILNEVGTSSYSVYVHTPPVYDYKYRYVIEWLSHQQNKPKPQDDKQPIYALILEPSSSDPQGEYFKQNQIKTKSSPYKTHTIDGITVEFYQKQQNEENIDKNILPLR